MRCFYSQKLFEECRLRIKPFPFLLFRPFYFHQAAAMQISTKKTEYQH